MRKVRTTVTAGKRIARSEDGTSAVEFAIVASVLITILLAIVQFGWALQVRSQMGRAADEAVRYVQLKPEASDAEFKNQVTAAMAKYDKKRLDVQTGQALIGSTQFRTVTVDYDLPLAIPGMDNLVNLSVTRRTPVLPAS